MKDRILIVFFLSASLAIDIAMQSNLKLCEAYLDAQIAATKWAEASRSVFYTNEAATCSIGNGDW